VCNWRLVAKEHASSQHQHNAGHQSHRDASCFRRPVFHVCRGCKVLDSGGLHRIVNGSRARNLNAHYKTVGCAERFSVAA